MGWDQSRLPGALVLKGSRMEPAQPIPVLVCPYKEEVPPHIQPEPLISIHAHCSSFHGEEAGTQSITAMTDTKSLSVA